MAYTADPINLEGYKIDDPWRDDDDMRYFELTGNVKEEASKESRPMVAQQAYNDTASTSTAVVDFATKSKSSISPSLQSKFFKRGYKHKKGQNFSRAFINGLLNEQLPSTRLRINRSLAKVDSPQ